MSNGPSSKLQGRGLSREGSIPHRIFQTDALTHSLRLPSNSASPLSALFDRPPQRRSFDWGKEELSVPGCDVLHPPVDVLNAQTNRNGAGSDVTRHVILTVSPRETGYGITWSGWQLGASAGHRSRGVG